MAARLKVFSWSDGFHAFTVAAGSRPKALQAWGVRQDLFKTGLAQEITDGPDHAAALKSPGEVIERGLAIDKGKIKPRAKSKAPSQAARRKVDTLEAELESLDADQAQEIADLDEEAEALRKRRDETEGRHAKAREALTKRLKAAREKL